MSLVLNVEILGEFKKLTAATRGAESQLQTMGKRAASVSKSINRAFAGIGIGLSFTLLAREIGEATKAAVDDRKSQELLALAMQNTTNATDDQIAAAEMSIAQMQIQAGVADDQLRPAYQKLFIGTGDVTKANKLLAIALDASAATGKDLDAVSQAMAKSLAGSDTALTKLIPSLKGSKNPIDDMARAFDGAAAAAANQDPYQKMQVIFGEIQERIGTALLPVLDDFAAWMSSPPGQAQLKEIADAAKDVLTQLAGTAKWAIANKDWLLPLVGGITALTGAANAIAGITTAIKGAQAAMLLFNATTLANPLVLAGAAILGVAAYTSELSSPAVTKETQNILAGKNAMIPGMDVVSGIPSVSKGVSPRVAERAPVNVVINTPKVSAQDVVNIINKAQKTGYTGQITMPRS